jgi:fructose-1,6-bisphosphatase/inositol monophosphatase family enzyme
MVAGVIMDPYRDELFWASVGGGAYLNGDRGIAHVFVIFGCFWLFFASVGRANLRLLHE